MLQMSFREEDSAEAGSKGGGGDEDINEVVIDPNAPEDMDEGTPSRRPKRAAAYKAAESIRVFIITLKIKYTSLNF